MMKLHMTAGSGNAYKLRLLLSMLAVPYEKVEVDLAARDPTFIAKSPRVQVPVLEDEGKVYWDSTAGLAYVALKHGAPRWLSPAAGEIAEVMQWLALSNNELHFGLQWARGVLRGHRRGDIEEYREYGRLGLAVLEGRLKSHDWLALGRATIADIACYPYVAVAPEGVLSLDAYPATSAWLRRFEALPGWIPRL